MRHLAPIGTVLMDPIGNRRPGFDPSTEPSIENRPASRALLVENLRGFVVGALGFLIWLGLGPGLGS